MQFLTAAVAGALASTAAAWGESGVVQVASNDWTTAPVQHHAAACGSSLYVPGTDPATLRQALYAFDASTSSWQRYGDMPGNFFTPSVFCSGGILFATGGASESSSAIVAMLPLSTGASAPWTTFNLTKKAGAIGARAGHRMAEVRATGREGESGGVARQLRVAEHAASSFRPIGWRHHLHGRWPRRAWHVQS